MTAASAMVTGSLVHTGPCVAVPRALLDAAWWMGRVSVPPRKEVPPPGYCLLDERGRHLGFIPAPAGRPRLGPREPAVYLRRNWDDR